jgi:hypothetical protein
VQNAAGSASVSGSPATGSASPSSRELCAQPGAVRAVIIARSGVLRHPVSLGGAAAPGAATPGGADPGSTGSPPIPSPGPSRPVLVPRPVVVKVVTSPARAQALARAVCALPRAPRGPVSCPAFFLGYYRLSFTADGHTLAPVTAQVSGCRLVLGAGGRPRQALKPGFWNVLARTGGWPATWPVHLPGGPVLPGGPTLAPPGSGQPGCSPPAGRFPPPAVPTPARPAHPVQAGASPGPCPGPYHPVSQSRQ